MSIYAERYKHIQNLGSGSSSRVFEVVDQKTGKSCALKLLNPALCVDANQSKAYTKEFEILKDLNHPNIAKVYDIGMINENDVDQIFIVTELIKGEDLFESTKAFDFQTYEILFVQCLRALNYIHQKDILHLDIKPQNILVTYDNDKPSAKLIDFGLARLINETKDKDYFGTQHYMSPEMASKQSYNHTTDIYSLGRSFYKVLTRDHPKDIQNPEAPSKINPQIPSEMDSIILKMIAPDVKKRYQNVTEILKDFQLLLNSSHDVETDQTNKSYLFSQKSFLAREEEFLHFKKVFEDRFLSMSLTCKPFLFIEGESGVGKTRFLKECEDFAKKNFTKVMRWHDFQGIDSFDDLSESCLILCDEDNISEEDLQYCEVFFENWPYLFLFTTKKAPSHLGEDCVISLQPFQLANTIEFVKETCQVNNLPDSLLKRIHQKTSGLPYNLTHYLNTLFEQGYLRDKSGRWSEKAIEDLAARLESTQALPLIESHLEKKFLSNKLNESHFKIFYILTVYDNPSWEVLHAFLEDYEIQNDLSYLIDAGFIIKDENLTYHFSNPLLKKVVFRKLDRELEQKICSNLATSLENANADEDKILYFRGRSGKDNAEKNLLQLGQIQKQKMKYELANETFEYLLQLPEIKQTVKEEALIELVNLNMETGFYQKAQDWIEQLSTDSNLSFTNQIRAFELKGIFEFRMGRLQNSTETFQEALKTLENRKPIEKSMQVILKSRLAQNLLDSNRVNQAETLFQEAWQQWKYDLNDNEKLKSLKNNIDTFYYAHGEYQKALDCLNEYWRILANKPHLESYGITLYKMARVHLKNNDLDLAEYKLQLCLKSMKKNQSYQWLASVYNELGILYRKKNDLHRALDSYQHAFDLQRKFSKGLALNLISFNLGNVNFQLNNPDEAQKFYKYAAHHLQQQPENRLAILFLFKCYVGLSGCALKNNDHPLAKQYLAKAHDLMTDKDLNSYSQYYWQQLVELHLSEQNKSKAIESLEKLKSLQSLSTFDKDGYKKWEDHVLKEYETSVNS